MAIIFVVVPSRLASQAHSSTAMLQSHTAKRHSCPVHSSIEVVHYLITISEHDRSNRCFDCLTTCSAKHLAPSNLDLSNPCHIDGPGAKAQKQ